MRKEDRLEGRLSFNLKPFKPQTSNSSNLKLFKLFKPFKHFKPFKLFKPFKPQTSNSSNLKLFKPGTHNTERETYFPRNNLHFETTFLSTCVLLIVSPICG
jgi:hypothetical protein